MSHKATVSKVRTVRQSAPYAGTYTYCCNIGHAYWLRQSAVF